MNIQRMYYHKIDLRMSLLHNGEKMSILLSNDGLKSLMCIYDTGTSHENQVIFILGIENELRENVTIVLVRRFITRAMISDLC